MKFLISLIFIACLFLVPLVLYRRIYFRPVSCIVINPGAYTHTSVAILDALKAVGLPAVEVHISDVSQREDFRQISYIRRACIATVTGKGFDGYLEAVDILTEKKP